jgi:hypothetical protein
LSLSEQRQGALRDQPVSPDLSLVVTSSCILDTSCDDPRDARVALVDAYHGLTIQRGEA